VRFPCSLKVRVPQFNFSTFFHFKITNMISGNSTEKPAQESLKNLEASPNLISNEELAFVTKRRKLSS